MKESLIFNIEFKTLKLILKLNWNLGIKKKIKPEMTKYGVHHQIKWNYCNGKWIGQTNEW